jgi:pullulanase/glycogen debranching enzyme
MLLNYQGKAEHCKKSCACSPDRDGNVQDAPPVADELAQDPSLAALKLVAWAADDSLLPRTGERGFPHWGRWAERNKRFTRDVVQWFAQGALPGRLMNTLMWSCAAHVVLLSIVLKAVDSINFAACLSCSTH